MLFRLFVSLVSDRMMPPAHLPSLPLFLPSLQLHNTESVVHSASAAPTSLLPSRPGDAVTFFFFSNLEIDSSTGTLTILLSLLAKEDSYMIFLFTSPMRWLTHSLTGQVTDALRSHVSPSNID